MRWSLRTGSVGGTAILILITIVNLAPDFLRVYLSDATGIWDNPIRSSSTMNYFGLGPFRYRSPLLVWAAVRLLWLTAHTRAASCGWSVATL